MSTKSRTILAWVFGIFIILIGIAPLVRQQFGGFLLLIAGALLLPPIVRRLSDRLTKKWRIMLVLVLFIIGVRFSPAEQSQQSMIFLNDFQVVTQESTTPPTPVAQEAVSVSSMAKIQFVYDIPSLIDKNYDQVKAILGKTTKVSQADNEVEALFIKQGFKFYVAYNPKTKKVTELFLLTDDPSGKTKDIDRLMDIGNLTKDDARYAVEFTRPLDDKSAYTGIEVRAAAAAKAKADRAKAVKDAAKHNIYARGCAQLEVTEMLKAPSTAKFPWSRDSVLFSPEENSYTVISYVDAQNSFGAMIRTNYICVVAADNMDKCHNVRCQLE